PSPAFLEVLYDALRKQEWYREHLESEEAPPLHFVGRFPISAETTTIATDIKNVLSIDDDLRNRVTSWGQFLTEFVRKAESIGVLVLRSGIVGSNTHRPLDVDEFRGFAISDNLAPLVFINSKDAKVAQIFTLAHELAHLWIGQSGISNLNYSKRPSQQENQIDRLCDSVAAEVLVPVNDFITRWNDSNTIDINVNILVRRYRVSALVILRRAWEYEKIEEEAYQTKLAELLRVRRSTGDESGGGNFYTNVIARNSGLFLTTLITATAEGRVPAKEAASLLNIAKLATLRKIESFVLESSVSGA
ncbi:MAG: ImmA/IrrE family metallo-endopeptidase, partial [Chloroflexi bacterium]|nr:ImmA/IrrE family metallo-endopeptidase [Chloroflexota bacterium]